MKKLYKLAAKFGGFYEDFQLAQRKREEEEERREAEEKEKNQLILEKVLSLVNGLDGPFGTGGLSEYSIKNIMDHDRKRAQQNSAYSDNIIVDALWKNSKVLIALDFFIDMNSGDITSKELRITYRGFNIPNEIKSKIEGVVGKMVYHKPSKIWEWDSKLDSNYSEGDKRIFFLTKELLS